MARANSNEPQQIGRQHALLTAFRRGFRDGASGGTLAIEGPRLIGDAIRAGLRLDHVLFSRTGLEHHGAKLLPQLSKHVQTGVAEDGHFASAMDSEHPQGVAALVQFAPTGLDAVFGEAGAVPLVLAAAGLQDPGNLGTLIRAADAFGATGVVALSDTVSPFHAKTVRAAAGSLFHLPVTGKIATAELIEACKTRGVRLVAAAANAPLHPEDAGLNQPTCLIIGQEAAGVPRELLRAADATVAIPMVRPLDSLNAGVAGSILLYLASRSRRNG